MALYRVKPGYVHGAQKQYTAGAVVELTEQEALGFLDKLQPLAPSTPPSGDEPPAGETKRRKGKRAEA